MFKTCLLTLKWSDMDTSIFIARIFSVTYISFGIGLLLNRNVYKKVLTDLIENKGILLLLGIIATVIGVAMINHHNYWNSDWTVIITVIAWVALFKGVFLIVFPNNFFFFKQLVSTNVFYKIVGPFALLFGLILGYFSFF